MQLAFDFKISSILPIIYIHILNITEQMIN